MGEFYARGAPAPGGRDRLTTSVGERPSDHGGHFIARHCGRKEVALTEFTTETTKSVEMRFGLDALGEHGHVELLAQRDDRLEQHVVASRLVDRADKGLVDLDDA